MDRQKDEQTEGNPIVPSSVNTSRGSKREMTQLWDFIAKKFEKKEKLLTFDIDLEFISA